MEKRNAPQHEHRLATALSGVKKLQEISTRLVTENNINQLYNDILDAAVNLMEADMGSIQLFVPESDELVLLAHKGLDGRTVECWQTVKVPACTAFETVPTMKRRVFIADIEHCESVTEDDREPFRWSAIRSIQTTPLVSRDGKVAGVLSTYWNCIHQPTEYNLWLIDILARQAADLIERSKAEKTLRESEERLRSAVLAAELGTFIWDLEKDEIKPDEQMLNLLEAPAATADLAVLFRSILHPDDANRYESAVEKARAPGGPGLIQEDIRIVLPRGGQRWLAFYARIYSLTAGTTEYMAGCVMDITHKKTLEQHKSEFIAIAGHELKTPVTGIKAYAQLLTDRFYENSEETNFLIIKKLGKLTNRLTKLLNKLLDSTKVMDGPLELNLEKADLNLLIGECVDDLQSLTRIHRIIFHSADRQTVLVDRERITQVLTNLILNAIKYSPDGGDIHVTSETTNDGQIKVSIKDLGIGIADGLKGRIFDRFFRTDDSDMQRLLGMGLGLYICDAIIQQHGGKIGVKSNGQKGTTFYFLLPHPETAVVTMSKSPDIKHTLRQSDNEHNQTA